MVTHMVAATTPQVTNNDIHASLKQLDGPLFGGGRAVRLRARAYNATNCRYTSHSVFLAAYYTYTYMGRASTCTFTHTTQNKTTASTRSSSTSSSSSPRWGPWRSPPNHHPPSPHYAAKGRAPAPCPPGRRSRYEEIRSVICSFRGSGEGWPTETQRQQQTTHKTVRFNSHALHLTKTAPGRLLPARARGRRRARGVGRWLPPARRPLVGRGAGAGGRGRVEQGIEGRGAFLVRCRRSSVCVY